MTTAGRTNRRQMSAECCPQEKGRAEKPPSLLPSPGPSTPSLKHAQRPQGGSAEKPSLKWAGRQAQTSDLASLSSPMRISNKKITS